MRQLALPCVFGHWAVNNNQWQDCHRIWYSGVTH